MPIIINLDVMLALRKVRLTELSERVGITMTNLSNLKTGKARAVRLTTLEAICEALDCQPGDLLEYRPDNGHRTRREETEDDGSISETGRRQAGSSWSSLPSP